MAETNFINRIAFHMTAETAVPVLPSKGSNIASLAGWTVIGTRSDGHEADLDEEKIEISFMDEYGEVRPARNLTRSEVVNFANGIDEVSFTAYDGSEALLSIGSSVLATNNISEAVNSTTYRTMIIEVGGLWCDYFPKCSVRINSGTGGYVKDPAKTQIVVRPCATDTIPGGWQRHHYQP